MAEETATNQERSGNSTEQRVRAIWEEVLEIPGISNDVQFLELGGDSLSAMLCISRMRKLLNVEFTIEDFFMESSTLSDFTKIIDEASLPEVRSAGENY